jgi:gas vesicle protein
MNDVAIGAAITRASMVESTECHLHLLIDDPLVAEALNAYPEGLERETYAITALRIGVQALNQAQGCLDADVVRNEGERILSALGADLEAHKRGVQEQVASTLREYFDPKSGRFNERLGQLLNSGGDLDRLLRAQIGQTDSELAKTLAAHFGEASPLMRILSPKETDGLLAGIHNAIAASLQEQRERILCEFSLDNAGSALARLVRELKDKHGELTNDLKGKVDEVVGEFSLDNKDSALSRLVSQVEAAQKRISSEFSLDAEDSALARMKRELGTLIEGNNKENEEFRGQVCAALAGLHARKEEAQRSTRHGIDFEEALFEFIDKNGVAAGDLVEHTGTSPGLIPRCKVGDVVITIGPEREASGARIVIEGKQKAGYDLKKALAEIDEGRRNRQASVGIFVFSKRLAPSSIVNLCRYGNDIVVVWDAEDTACDVHLQATLSLARALCVREAAQESKLDFDFDRMQKAIHEVERHAQGLDEIKKTAQSIRSGADKIEERARIIADGLGRSARQLNEEVEAVKGAIATAETE